MQNGPIQHDGWVMASRGKCAKSAAVIGLCGLLAVTAGCSVTESVPYPNLGAIKRITKKILTPEQKDAEIRDLALEKDRHRQDAEQEIEKR